MSVQSFILYLRILFCFFTFRASLIHYSFYGHWLLTLGRACLRTSGLNLVPLQPITNPSSCSPHPEHRIMPSVFQTKCWHSVLERQAWKSQGAYGVLTLSPASGHLTQVEQQVRQPHGQRTPAQETPKEALIQFLTSTTMSECI